MSGQEFISFCCSSTVPLILDNADICTSETDIIDCFIQYMKTEYKINIVAWEPSSSAYPNYMFLGGDRGILAYISFRYIHSSSSITLDDISWKSKEVLKTVCAASSQLDRPVFYIYLINTADRIGIYFETDEQIRDRWLSTDFSSDIYTPVTAEMGDFQNLLSIFLDFIRINNGQFPKVTLFR